MEGKWESTTAKPEQGSWESHGTKEGVWESKKVKADLPTREGLEKENKEQLVKDLVTGVSGSAYQALDIPASILSVPFSYATPEVFRGEWDEAGKRSREIREVASPLASWQKFTGSQYTNPLLDVVGIPQELVNKTLDAKGISSPLPRLIAEDVGGGLLYGGLGVVGKANMPTKGQPKTTPKATSPEAVAEAKAIGEQYLQTKAEKQAAKDAEKAAAEIEPRSKAVPEQMEMDLRGSKPSKAIDDFIAESGVWQSTKDGQMDLFDPTNPPTVMTKPPGYADDLLLSETGRKMQEMEALYGKYEERAQLPSNVNPVDYTTPFSAFEHAVTVSKNAFDMVEAVRAHASDPTLLRIAEEASLLGEQLKKVYAKAVSPEIVREYLPQLKTLVHSAGVQRTYVDGRSRIYLRGKGFEKYGYATGLNPRTVMHEVIHAITQDALMLAEHPYLSSLPEFSKHVQYAKDLGEIQARLKQVFPDTSTIKDPLLKRIIDESLTDIAELNSYGLEHPTIQAALKSIKMSDGSKQTLWQRLVSAVYNMLGKGTEYTAFAKLLDMSKDWADLKVDAATRAEVAKHRLKNNVPIDKPQASAVNKKHGVSKQVEDYLEGRIPKYTDINEIPNREISDLPKVSPVKVFPMNVQKMLMSNPVVTAAAHLVRRIDAETAQREFWTTASYLELKKDVIAKGLTSDQWIDSLGKLVQSSADKKFVAAIAAGGDAATLLRAKFPGLNELQIKTIIDLENLYRTQILPPDQATAQKIGNRQLNPIAWYGPLTRDGPYMVYMRDTNGSPVVLKGFKSLSDALRYKKNQEAAVQQAGLPFTLSDPVFNKNTGVSDFIQSMGVDSFKKLPEFVQTILNKMQAGAEAHRVGFEFERNAENLGGYVGHYHNYDVLTRQDKRLLEGLFVHRLAQSVNFERRARLLNEILIPAVKGDKLDGKPNLRRWVESYVYDQMGLDVVNDGIKKLESTLVQSFEQAAYKPYLELSGKWKDIEANKQVMSEQALTSLVRGAAMFATVMKLAGNVTNMIVNTSTIALVPAHLVKQASLLGGGEPITATIKMWHNIAAPLKYMDRGLLTYLQKRFTAGEIFPNEYAAILDQTGDSILTSFSERAFNKLMAPDKLIETVTNLTSQTAAYFFVMENSKLGHLGKAEKYQLIDSISRELTADYTRASKPPWVAEGGFLGAGVWSFMNWSLNSIGQLLRVGLKDTRKQPLPALSAIGSILAAQYMISGLQGLPIASEIEDVNRLIRKYTDFSPPSINQIFRELGVPDEQIYGPVSTETNLDLSSSTRFSTVSGFGSVPLSTAMDVSKSVITMYDMIRGKVTDRDRWNAVRGVPKAFQGITEHEVGVITPADGDPGSYRVSSPMYAGNPSYTLSDKNPDVLGVSEPMARMLGLKSTRQRITEDREMHALQGPKKAEKEVADDMALLGQNIWRQDYAGRLTVTKAFERLQKAGVSDQQIADYLTKAVPRKDLTKFQETLLGKAQSGGNDPEGLARYIKSLDETRAVDVGR